MAKGVKKIKITKGLYYPKMSVLGQRITIKPDQWVYFGVDDWLPGTTAEDKKKELIWMRQSSDKQVIVAQLPSANGYKLMIPKRICGSYHYYIEASLSGVRDKKNATGLYVKGWCEPKIISSKWTLQRGSSNSIKNNKKDKYIAYGQTVYLNLLTEGLNGNILTIELWNQQLAKDDKKIFVYNNVQVIDGEVNLKIDNTYAWMAAVNRITDVEEFYIKVKDDASKTYIKDNLGDDLHAIYLNVKNKVSSTNVNVSQNQTPTKVYKPDVSTVRYEPCKFEFIKITETGKKEGKADNTTVDVFDNGKGLKNISAPQEHIQRTIFFKFDSTIIDKDGEAVLNNILKFLLEHKGATISLSGYACVIGKQNYNKSLSQRRADVVKKFFGDGGLDRSRITASGKGEVDPTDDKMGRDNIKYRNEESYENNRRVDISFVFNAHNAQTISYEVVAPTVSTKKELIIDVVGFDTKICFRDSKNKHKKEIYMVDVGQTIDSGDTRQTFDKPSFPYKVYSNLSRFNAAPLAYIWPMATNPNQFHLHVHSCRYFSSEKTTPVLIKAYPDIKWTLEFSFNFSNAAAYTHGNLPEYSRQNPLPDDVKDITREMRKAQSKAVSSGKESARLKNSPEMLTKFGLKLQAEWDGGAQKTDYGGEFAEKLRRILGIFIRYKEIADRVKGTLGGAVMKSSSKPPFMFEVESPSLSTSVSWYLERGAGDYDKQISTVGTLNFKADPLVGANFVIDLLAVGSRMHPFVAAFVAGLQGTLALANGGITLEAKFYGQFSVDFKALEINTLNGGIKGGNLDLGAKLGLKILLKVSASVVLKGFSAKPLIEINVTGQFDAYFSAKLSIDSEEKKGLYVKPFVGFSGLIVTFEVEIVIRGIKTTRKFGNENDPFLKADIDDLPKFYLT
ncbi:OmpA family protein [Chryseobacterium sp. Mn2064]|uniref:OmpA family protein n=1 Tax=Chryseobacterium sp. Mn2064 TaxID=3395263 RepID=UPI003BBF4707